MIPNVSVFKESKPFILKGFKNTPQDCFDTIFQIGKKTLKGSSRTLVSSLKNQFPFLEKHLDLFLMSKIQ